MINILVSVCAGLAASYAFLWSLLRFTQDEREPPAVNTTIPFMSPLISMYSAGLRYWSMNRLVLGVVKYLYYD